MKEKFVTVQLRSSIFFQQNIGYTPDNAQKFQNLLGLSGSTVYGIPQLGVPTFGVNPTIPQFGMPWRLFKKENDNEYNIAFQPGKIDFILAKEAPYESDLEIKFCERSIDWFSKILGMQEGQTIQRIAYSPLYAIQKDDIDKGRELWRGLLKKIVFDGSYAQDIDLQFVLKRVIDFNGYNIRMNLLHHFFDGIQTVTNGTSQTTRQVLLVQLDLNSVPEEPLSLDKNGLSNFYNEIISIKNELIDNVES